MTTATSDVGRIESPSQLSDGWEWQSKAQAVPHHPSRVVPRLVSVLYFFFSPVLLQEAANSWRGNDGERKRTWGKRGALVFFRSIIIIFSGLPFFDAHVSASSHGCSASSAVRILSAMDSFQVDTELKCNGEGWLLAVLWRFDWRRYVP